MLFRNPFHRLQPMKRPGGDDSDTISRVEDLIESAWAIFLADLERFLVTAGVAKPGVPPNPSTVNRLTGPAVVYTDANGNLRVDPAHFIYTPSPGSGIPATLLVGAGPPGASQGVIAQFFAKVGATSPAIVAAGQNAGANPLTSGQPFLVLANDGGNFSGLAFLFGSRITTCGITAAIDGSIQISAPDFGSAGAGFGGLSIYADLAQTTRIARFDPHGTHGSVTVDSLQGIGTVPVNCDSTGLLVRGTVPVPPTAVQYQSFQWSGYITDPSWQAISGDVRAVWCPADAGRVAPLPVIANGRTGDTTVPAYLTDTLGSVIGYQVVPMHVTSGIRTMVEAAVCVQSLIPTFVAPADAIGFQFTIWKVTGGFPQSNPANYTAMATQGFSFSGAGFQQGAAGMTISVAGISELDFLFCEVHRTDTSGANVLSSMTFTVNARFST